MRKHNPKNNRVTRQYLGCLEEARRMSVRGTDQVAAASAAFEVSTGYRDFAQFHIEQARKFKRDLGNATNPEIKKRLAKATVRSRLMQVKAFIHWPADMTGPLASGSSGRCQAFSNHSCSLALWNFQIRFGPAITFR